MNISEKAVLPGWIQFVLNFDSLYKTKLHSKKLKWIIRKIEDGSLSL